MAFYSSKKFGGSGVDTTGTPANNQIAIWTDVDTLEGDSNLTWDNYLKITHSSNPYIELNNGSAGGYVQIASGDLEFIAPSSGDVNLRPNGSTTTYQALSGGTHKFTGDVGIDQTPLTALSLLANSASAYTDGILLSSSTSYGLSLWHNTASATTSYIDDRYDSASSSMKFRMRANGTPVEALTLLGSGAVSVGKASYGSVVTSSGTCDLSAGNHHKITISGATAVTTSNATNGQSGVIKLVHDGTNVPTFTGFYWPEGTLPSISSASGAVDIIPYFVCDTYVYANILKGMATV